MAYFLKIKVCLGAESGFEFIFPQHSVRTLTPDSQGHRDTKSIRDMDYESEKPSQKHERKCEAEQGDPERETETQSDLEKPQELRASPCASGTWPT